MSSLVLIRRLEGSAPILRVENMKDSLQFYVDVLGFA